MEDGYGFVDTNHPFYTHSVELEPDLLLYFLLYLLLIRGQPDILEVPLCSFIVALQSILHEGF